MSTIEEEQEIALSLKSVDGWNRWTLIGLKTGSWDANNENPNEFLEVLLIYFTKETEDDECHP